MPFFQKPLAVVKRKQLVTLQVRISRRLYGYFEKRVFSSASFCGGVMMKRRLPASLTVEAALALSLFLFAMVILMMPMKMMNESRKIQTALESVCEEVSQFAVLLPGQGESPKDSEDGRGFGEIAEELIKGVTKAGVIIYAERMVRRQVPLKKAGSFSFSDSRILEDGETIDLVLHYRLSLPFPIFRIESVPMTARSSRRAWLGKEGGRGAEGEGEGEMDEVVYVGKSSTRYHRDRNCHYLNNNVEPASFDLIGGLRNAEGKKYRACARCGNSAGPGSTVYVMPSGESFHSDRNCSSIIAYVRAVPLSEVEHLGACSYCSQ